MNPDNVHPDDRDPHDEPFPWLAVLGIMVCLTVAVLLFLNLGCSTTSPC